MAGPASLMLAFAAGVASFLSPCVVPLVPTYLTFLVGRGSRTPAASRRQTFGHGLLFVVGFSLVFIALGLTASSLGHWLRSWQVLVRPLSGLIVILFGLVQLGWLRLDFLQRGVHLPVPKTAGALGSVTVGMAFAAGWTPCVGPVLSSILLLASNQQSAWAGAYLLAAYAAGLAVPFLLAAAFASHWLPFFRRLNARGHWVETASGVLLLAIGVMLYTNTFTRLAAMVRWRI